MDSCVFRMKIFNLFTLALSLVLVEAMNIDPRNIEPRNVRYVAPGRSVTFASNSRFGVAMKTNFGMFETDSTASLSASCTAKLPCSSFASAVGIGSGSELLGYFCTSGSSAESISTMTSVGSLNLLMFSGLSSGSQYRCQIRSVAAITTTTSQTTGPVITSTDPIVTDSGPVCQCGTIGGPKIVGGTDVTEGEIPWQVGLGSGSVGSFSIFCGGTLISADFVITAAHCIKSTDLTVKIFLGSVDLRSTSAAVVGLSQIMPHEEYEPRSVKNDIVVMRLASSVTFTSKVFPACLPRKFTTEHFDEKSLVVSGWGTIQSGGSFSPDIMLKATVVGITNAQCNSQYGFGTILAGMLCAEAPGKDSCQGDSGGPLTYTMSDVTYLVGVVSFGQGCADPSYAGVYTRVTYYLDWIDSKTGTPMCSK